MNKKSDQKKTPLYRFAWALISDGLTAGSDGCTAGSNGFPNLNHLNDSNDLSAVRTMKLPQKQAIKMTQMPIFIQEPGGTHRMVTSNKKKETPKQKFKALPGIGYSQHEIPKTVVKGSTSKLHGLKDSRTRPFEP